MNNLSLKLFYCLSFSVICCGQSSNNKPKGANSTSQRSNNKVIINNEGNTIQTRFNTPIGFERKPLDEHSFGYFLRNLPLKPSGTKAKFFNGTETFDLIYDAVLDLEIGNRDLEQCADAIMRLRGEYFYSQKEYDKISFTLTNGFKVDYSQWMKGNRIIVSGNKTSWKKISEPSNNYKDFRNYMDLVFNYAGSLSLSKSLNNKSMEEISIGDVFIIGALPGHAIIVVDVAENKSGEKVFMVAQSYMPAQDIQILKNLNNEKLSPWYKLNVNDDLVTPKWTFSINQLKTW